ncbi:MAG: FAD-binding oxidoreductase [Candidatus Bathyarchaeia archaeon]
MNPAVKDLIDIVGSDNFFNDAETLELYSKDYSFTPRRRPSAVVKIKDPVVLQQVIDWANKTKTPLVPVSSGEPHFRGDTVPSVGGCVIVDLSSMNRIIRINRLNRYVVIEPGVTYLQLQQELGRFGMRVPMPLLPKSGKSVLASLLEREPVMMPNIQWTLLDPLCCVGIIWGCGKEYATGEAGYNVRVGALKEQWEREMDQIFPYGPGMWDAHRIVSGAQGTMGIVKWASVRCELLPREYEVCFITSEKLETLLKFLGRFLRFRYGDEIILLNNWNLASILCKEISEIQSVAANLSRWSLIIVLAGYDILPKERVAFQVEDTYNLAEQFGLKVQDSLPGVMNGKEIFALLSKPSEDPYWKMRWKGSFQEIFFLTTIKKIVEFEALMTSIANESGYPASQIGCYIQPLHQGVTYHVEFDLPYDPAASKEAKTVEETFVKASEVFFKHGAYFSRPYGIWSKMVYGSDYSSTYVLKEMKKIFDPNNIMNPGKLCF